MATLHPFSALRPVKEFAEKIACVPYDVINTEEARRLAEGNAESFLHVIRPEIDLQPGIDEYDDSVYERGALNLRRYIHSQLSVREERPSLYVYRLIMDGRGQTGIFGCVSVEDYDDDVILKHEKTRPAKEDDRTRHIVSQRAHAEPVMLTFRDDAAVQEVIDITTGNEPLYDFVADDGVRHSVWRVVETARLVTTFAGIDRLYVADGHHRCKAASRAAEAMQARTDISDEVGYFPAVLFPMGNMKIMAYNRIIRKLPTTAEAFLTLLRSRFESDPTGGPVPNSKGSISIYMDGSWHAFHLPEAAGDSVLDSLDVSRLSSFMLEPLLQITDPRTDSNIDFVGGIRGTAELERLVDSGRAEMAISMYPTSIEELVQVSDESLLMPPKSTWFEPKLRSGLLVHLF